MHHVQLGKPNTTGRMAAVLGFGRLARGDGDPIKHQESLF